MQHIEVVTILRQWLERQAFHVFGFTEPALALEHFRANSKKYGLLISDLRMPEINGYEFIKRAKEIKPEVKVLGRLITRKLYFEGVEEFSQNVAKHALY